MEGGQQKGRPVMLLFPGGRSARIPFPRDPDDLRQRILKFAHGAIDPLLVRTPLRAPLLLLLVFLLFWW
jgi:hypothetical protein